MPARRRSAARGRTAVSVGPRAAASGRIRWLPALDARALIRGSVREACLSFGSVRAFEVSGPRESRVVEVESPRPAAGHVVVDVALAGVCGTDVELFTGEMAYLKDGRASYPLRLGHEWCGVVAEVGDGVEPGWIGRGVMGDTIIGCGHCRRCLAGRHWVCETRAEVGIRGPYAGALAEQLTVPATSLHGLPDSVDDRAGAMVEPGGNALRAVRAAAVQPGERVLVAGLGTIGLLAAMFARADGAEVHLLGRSTSSLDRARALWFERVWSIGELPALPWDAVKIGRAHV